MPRRRLLPPRPCQPAHLLADKPPLDFSLRFFPPHFLTIGRKQVVANLLSSWQTKSLYIPFNSSHKSKD